MKIFLAVITFCSFVAIAPFLANYFGLSLVPAFFTGVVCGGLGGVISAKILGLYS